MYLKAKMTVIDNKIPLAPVEENKKMISLQVTNKYNSICPFSENE
jgi:hypothetical protein